MTENIEMLTKENINQTRNYHISTNAINYPEEISKLVNEHKIEDAQRLYFEEINNQRRGLIRL